MSADTFTLPPGVPEQPMREACRWDPEHAAWLAGLVQQAGGFDAVASALGSERTPARYTAEGWRDLLGLMLEPGGDSLALLDVAVSHVLGVTLTLALPSAGKRGGQKVGTP